MGLLFFCVLGSGSATVQFLAVSEATVELPVDRVTSSAKKHGG